MAGPLVETTLDIRDIIKDVRAKRTPPKGRGRVISERVIRPRTLSEKFRDDYTDAASRSLVGAGVRKVADFIGLDQREGETEEQHDARIVQAERNRRQAFEQRQEDDRLFADEEDWLDRAAANTSWLAANVLGGADPTYLIAPGGSVGARIAAQAAVAGASDAGIQGLEMAEGVRDEFDPVQTGSAVAVGGAFQGGSEALQAGARRVAQGLRGNDNLGPTTPELTPQLYADRLSTEGMDFANSPEAIEFFTTNAPAIQRELVRRAQGVTPEQIDRRINDVQGTNLGRRSTDVMSQEEADAALASVADLPEATAPEGTPIEVDVVAGYDPEEAARQLARLNNQGTPDTLTFPNGRTAEVTTYTSEELAARPSLLDMFVERQEFSDAPPAPANTNISTAFQEADPRPGYTGSIGPRSSAGPAVQEAAQASGSNFRRQFRSREATYEAGSDLGLNADNFDTEGDIGDISAVAARGAELAYEASQNLIRSIARNGADSPQTAQAIDEFTRVLPRQIENAGEVGRGLNILGDGDRRTSAKTAEALKKLAQDPARKAELETLAKRYDNDPEAAVKILRDMAKPSLRDNIFTFRYNMMLSSPETQLYNTIGTGGNILWDLGVERSLAGLAGAVRGAATGSLDRVTGAELLARWAGAYDGFRNGWKLAREGFRTGRTADQVDRAEMRKGRVGRFELPIKAIAAQDELFRSIAEVSDRQGMATRFAVAEGLKGKALRDRATELARLSRTIDKDSVRKAAAEQAKQEGLRGAEQTARIKELVSQNVPLQIRESATEYAKRMRFQDDPSAIGQAIERLRSRKEGDTPLNKLGADAVALIVPFIRTPDSLVRTTLRRSPAGLLEGKNFADLKSGGAKRDEALARVAAGSAVTGGIAYGVLNGAVTGAGPRDYEKRRQMEANGWQANSLYVPGQGYVSYEGLEPLSLLLSGVATTMERWDEGDDKGFLDKAALQSLNAAELLTNSTWSEGLSDTLAVLSGRDENGRTADVSNLLANIVSSFTTPSVVRQINQAYVDPIKRDTKGDGSVTDRIVDRTMAGYPGFSDELPAQVDLLGRPQRQPEALGPDILSRLNIAPEAPTPVSEEINRLTESDPEAKVLLRAAPRTLDGVKLKAEDAQKLQAFTGTYVRLLMEDALADPEYQQMTDDEKRDELKAIIKDARKWAKEDAFPEAFGEEEEEADPSSSSPSVPIFTEEEDEYVE